MERFVLMMKLKKDRVNDYIDIHKKENVWTEIIELNKKAGVNKEKIFLYKNIVFNYIEAESYEKMIKVYNKDNNMKEWFKIIMPMVENQKESNEWSKKIDLIYDYEDGRLL